MTDRSLAKARKIIRRIEAARAKDDFPARPGFHCETMPCRDICTAYQRWAAKNGTSRDAVQVASHRRPDRRGRQPLIQITPPEKSA